MKERGFLHVVLIKGEQAGVMPDRNDHRGEPAWRLGMWLVQTGHSLSLKLLERTPVEKADCGWFYRNVSGASGFFPCLLAQISLTTFCWPLCCLGGSPHCPPPPLFYQPSLPSSSSSLIQHPLCLWCLLSYFYYDPNFVFLIANLVFIEGQYKAWHYIKSKWRT